MANKTDNGIKYIKNVGDIKEKLSAVVLLGLEFFLS
jgi:hypothetical protein